MSESMARRGRQHDAADAIEDAPGRRRADDAPFSVEPAYSVEPPSDIATLPPLDEMPVEVPISHSTGQPRRSKMMLTGVLFLYAAAGASAVALAIAWWTTIHVGNWPNSINLIRWFHPGPGTWESVLLVCIMGAIGVAMTAAPAVVAFQAWNGHRWSRWAGLVVCALLAGLALLMNRPAWVALPLTAVGTVLLFLPPVSRYFQHWRVFRTPDPAPELRREPVFYGPLARYR